MKTEVAAHVDTAVYRDGGTDWLWIAHTGNDDADAAEATVELWRLSGSLREKVLEMDCDNFATVVCALGYVGEGPDKEGG